MTPSAARAYDVPVYGVTLVRESGRTAEYDLQSPVAATTVLGAYLADADREHFVVLLLNTQLRLIGIHTAAIGTLDKTLVHPREVFKAALLANAHSIIVGHNHPGGKATPSPDDWEVTEQLRSAGATLGVEVIDHIIVAEGGAFCSMKGDDLWGALLT